MSDLKKQFETYFDEKYSPAKDEQDATTKMTTVELYKSINKSFPGLFSVEELTDFLSQKGFTFTDIDFEFEWLIKQK